MVKIEKLIIACLTVILILSTSLSRYTIFAQTQGPRTEDLIIKFYSNIVQAYNALKNDEIDAIGYELTSDLYQDAILDPNIVLGPVGDRGKYQFDLNNNYTATDLNNGRRNPCSYLDFRRGVAFCVDKDLVVDTFCGGFADRIDQPMSYMQRGWRNQSYWYEDGTYPYEFNLVSASNAFDAAGFIQGSDANPDYDAGVSGSVPYLRIHPDKGTTMNDLEVCSRIDDARRYQAGVALVAALRLCGVPVNSVEADSYLLYRKVFDNFDYHVYTGGWSLGRFPAVTAFGLYHSSQYFLSGSNYVTGNDSLGNPAHPILDAYLYGARYLDSYSETRDFVRKAMGQHVEECVTMELFSAKSYWCWRSDLLGVVNAGGLGLENGYTFLNAYKVDGSPIRYGLKTSPGAMNKIYSQWFYDFQCLDRMDLYGGMDVPPYDYSVIQPGYILDWTTGTWDDGGESKTLVSQTYRDDAWFVEPSTGNQLEHVNASHHYASIWYEYQLPTAWNNEAVMDIKYVNITGDYSYDIYWNVTGYWNTFLPDISFKSFNWWSKGNLSQTVTETLTSAGSGWLGCTEPAFFVLSIEQGGTPLIRGIDYRIEMDPDGPHKADVHILNPSYIGVPIDISYLATDDAKGYYPGGLPWQDCFEGAGMYYAIDFTPGSGGNLTLKRNPFYPTETPLLGEVDFAKKNNGCYKIDIFDIVRGVNAYGSQGINIPDANWFPGADLAYPGGQIDIFDIVTIAGKYGQEWGCSP